MLASEKLALQLLEPLRSQVQIAFTDGINADGGKTSGKAAGSLAMVHGKSRRSCSFDRRYGYEQDQAMSQSVSHRPPPRKWSKRAYMLPVVAQRARSL